METSPLAPFDSVDVPHPNSREQLAAALRQRGLLPADAPEGTTLNGAILAFQKSEGLPQTGFPDDETLWRLGIDPGTKDRTLDPRPVCRPGATGAGREPLMALAAILVVDDRLEELARLGQELRKRYGHDYDILEASSGGEALEVLRARREADRPVALVLAVHWMKPITGIELLGRVRELHPIARRGLLVDWGDRSCNGPLLEAMSLGSVDYFVLKPMVEPDEEFHQAIGAFLADWSRFQGIGFKSVRCIGDPHAARSHELRDILTRNGLLHDFVNAATPEGLAELRTLGMSRADLPVVIVLDRPPMANPSNARDRRRVRRRPGPGPAVRRDHHRGWPVRARGGGQRRVGGTTAP